MTITQKQLDELRALAEAATPGPWVEDDGNIFSKSISDATTAYIMRLCDDPAFKKTQPDQEDRPEPLVAKCDQDLPNFEADAYFITAANPQVVLQLLSRIEELEQRPVRGAPKDWPCPHLEHNFGHTECMTCGAKL